jgi:hypothetical protein
MPRAAAAIAILVALFRPIEARGADDLAIWKNFSWVFRDGQITADRIRPYFDELREPLLDSMAAIGDQAKPEDWRQPPEIHRVGDQIHFLIALTTTGGRKTFCFTVVVESETWFLRQVESIFIRLDQIGPPPVSRFREENTMTERVRLFNLLAQEKGKSFAYQWFKDGEGYFLSARTWAPFVPAARAFILYLCWEQSNLRGRPVTLASLGDRQAVVDVDAVEWRLYEQTGHLRQMISREDYQALYETVWQDRAAVAGWDLRIEYAGAQVRFWFERHQAESPGGQESR